MRRAIVVVSFLLASSAPWPASADFRTNTPHENVSSARQTAQAIGGDASAGLLAVGVVSAGPSHVEVTNISLHSHAKSGDAITKNKLSISNSTIVPDAASAVSGDGVGGQIAGLGQPIDDRITAIAEPHVAFAAVDA